VAPEKCHPLITSIIIRNNATAVPSLNKLSPSNNKLSLFGVHKSLNRASTATGSVAEIIIPKSKVIINGTGRPIQLRKK
jgi:hypothetical protein